MPTSLPIFRRGSRAKGGGVYQTLRKSIMITAVSAAVAGCAGMAPTPPPVSGKAALDALARGDYATAETEAAQAVRMHPNDPYALIALALTYELTGRPLQAREYYLIVQALNPEGTIVLNDGIERRLIDVAQVRLAALSGPAQGEVGRQVTAEQAWTNVQQRFHTLRRLVQAGLATEAEYSVRRAANTGALLPYSDAPAAISLDQRPPSYEAVAQRLAAINAALTQNSISPADHAAERVSILDGLLPAAPRERVTAVPPLDPLLAPAYLGHLRSLRSEGLISADEAARERAAVERIAGPAGMPGVTPPPSTGAAPAKPAAAKPGKPPKPAKAEKPAKPAKAEKPAKPAGTGSHGVQLAAYGSEALARDGWEKIRRHFPDLAGLSHSIQRADLGAKGVVYRLRVGPLASAQAAQALCGKLQAKGQACNPVRF